MENRALSRPKRVALAAILLCPFFYPFASNALSVETKCGYLAYRYEKSFLRDSKVSVNGEDWIDWRQWCAKSQELTSVLVDEFPLVHCKNVEERAFSEAKELDPWERYEDERYRTLNLSGNEPVFTLSGEGDNQIWLRYYGVQEEDSRSEFSRYDVKRVLEESSVNGSWNVTLERTHTLNFDLKRQQFSYHFLSIDAEGDRHEYSVNNGYPCE